MAIGTPRLAEAIERARERAGSLDEDLASLAERVRGARPAAVAPQAQQRARRRFLETLYSEEGQAEQAFERIIGGNELQDVNYLPRGSLVARAILRIVIRATGGRVLGYGTGVLIGDGVLLTNNHVLPNSDVAGASYAEAHYERSLEGSESPAQAFALQPDKLWYTCKPLDFTVVGIAETDRAGSARLDALGWVPLVGTVGKVLEGEWLTIVQHPRGERKQLCIRENQLLKCQADVLWYSTDTLGGSSGSPVFNNDWLMVALHHSGVPETKNGMWQTIHGRDYDPARDGESDIKWVANEGIRVSRIVETLRTDNAVANAQLVQPLLKLNIGDIQVRAPVLFRGGASQRPAAVTPAVPVTGPATHARSPFQEDRMSARRISVTLEVDSDGRVQVVNQQAAESTTAGPVHAERGRERPVIAAPVVPERDWVGGYRPDFLQHGERPDPDLIVPLPNVRERGKIAPLIDQYGQTFSEEKRADGVLSYKGFSVVMNKDRRFAFFSAANVDGGMRTMVSGRNDKWLYDDRIARDHQVDNSFYRQKSKGQPNLFDRGHLTRRDDMEWGTDVLDAVNRANGTCVWTNCAAQHEVFNQGRGDTLLWQDLEKYILEQTAAHHQFRAQVITGPIFGAADPVFRGIAYPLDYWKVVVAVTAQGKPFATGYILSQKEVIDRFGLGVEATLDVPFGAFGTYQRTISEIENATGLTFTYGPDGRSLSEVDPLMKNAWRPNRRRRRSGSQESTGADDSDALQSFDDLVLS